MHDQDDVFSGMGRLLRSADVPAERIEALAGQILEKHAGACAPLAAPDDAGTGKVDPQLIATLQALVVECERVSATFRSDILVAQRVAGKIHMAQRRLILIVIGLQLLGMAGIGVLVALIWRLA